MFVVKHSDTKSKRTFRRRLTYEDRKNINAILYVSFPYDAVYNDQGKYFVISENIFIPNLFINKKNIIII